MSFRAPLVVVLSLGLTGCYVKTHGVQTTNGGTTTTVTSTQVLGTASFSGGKAAFSSGRVPPPSAPGGHAYLGQGATVVLITGLMLADLFNYIRGVPRPKELPADAKIMDTCSCYQKPVKSDE
jgi:hypothetical protein